MLPNDLLASLHDLGNLLTVIDATTERLRLARANPSESPLLADLATAAKRATEIVREMKYGARQSAQFEPTDIVEVVGSLRRALAAMVGPEVELGVELKVDGARIRANRRMVEQAIFNLVSNARDAMKSRGHVHIVVEVLPIRGHDSLGNLLPTGDYAVVAVRDDGPGFNVASVPKLFEPFFTTKPTGTGLGLRLVADVARAHRGGVYVISEPGRGATFTMVIPLALPADRGSVS